MIIIFNNYYFRSVLLFLFEKTIVSSVDSIFDYSIIVDIEDSANKDYNQFLTHFYYLYDSASFAFISFSVHKCICCLIYMFLDIFLYTFGIKFAINCLIIFRLILHH